MAWRLARSLIRLRDQADALAPRRSKRSDGTIGDRAHASRRSGHNPDSAGIVRALDITHDPGNGMDVHALADRVLAEQDPRLKYVISRGRIGSGPAGPSPGRWRRYRGSNPHDLHAHFEVIPGAAGDRDGAWALRTRPLPEDDVTHDDIKAIAEAVRVEIQPMGGAGIGDELDRIRRTLRKIADATGVQLDPATDA